MTALPLSVPAEPIDTICEQAAKRRAHAIAAFVPSARKAILQLTSQSPAMADLAETFPALLYALTTGYGTLAARETATALIEAGAPLRHVAVALALPWWLRRLPAAALDGSLAGLPHNAELAQKLACAIPADPAIARCWLASVAYGCRAAGPGFGVWLGGWIGRANGCLMPIGSDNLRLLAAWAWASQHAETRLGRLVRRRWSNAISPRRALEELCIWRQRVELAIYLAAREPTVSLASGTAHGLAFVPLADAEAFIDEAARMDNCLDQYGARLALRRSHIVSIRRDGRPVADLEIGPHDEEPSMPAVRQLRGPRNRCAGAEIWRATYAWLGEQRFTALARHADGSFATRRTAAQELWRAYQRDVGPGLTPAEAKALARMIIGLAGKSDRRAPPARASLGPG